MNIRKDELIKKLRSVAATVAAMAVVVQVGCSSAEEGRERSSEPGRSASPTTRGPRGTKSSPLPLGASARVGDWDVKVTSFDPEASSDVRAAAPSNEGPRNGAYGLAELRVTYRGNGLERPGIGLTAVMVGGDGAQYPAFDCEAVTPRPLEAVQELGRGERAVGDVCFDHPPAASPGSTVFVTAEAASPPVREYWGG